jgi:Sulfotransferase family
VILSSRHRFLFVHIPKTAGTAMHVALTAYADPQSRPLLRRLSRHLPVVEAPGQAHFRIHDTAARIRAKLSPAVWDGFLSFAVVRNPYDHAVSHYEYMKQFRTRRIAERVRAMGFEEFLAWRIKPKLDQRVFLTLPSQSHFVTDAKGALLVNRILHFETLAEETAALFADLGLPDPQLKRLNPTHSRADGRSYADYYTPTTQTMVETIYGADFERFGYQRGL